MTILLLLNLNSKNLGDDFIANEIENSLNNISSDKHKIISRNFVFFRSYHTKTLGLVAGYLRMLFHLISAQQILIAGGNLLMPRSNAFLIAFFMIVMTAKLFKKKISICCVGASGFNNDFRSKIFRFLLQDVAISVRDNTSQTLLNTFKISSKTIADAAFLHEKKTIKKFNFNKILLIPMSYEAFCFEKNSMLDKEDYYRVYSNFISSIKSQYEIQILTTDAVDESIALSLSSEFGLKLIRSITIEDLKFNLSIFDGIVISTRMHGGIISLLYGLPVVFLNWHPKILGLSEELNCQTSVIDLQSFTIKNIVKSIQTTDWNEVDKTISAKHELLLNHINEIIS